MHVCNGKPLLSAYHEKKMVKSFFSHETTWFAVQYSKGKVHVQTSEKEQQGRWRSVLEFQGAHFCQCSITSHWKVSCVIFLFPILNTNQVCFTYLGAIYTVLLTMCMLLTMHASSTTWQLISLQLFARWLRDRQNRTGNRPSKGDISEKLLASISDMLKVWWIIERLDRSWQ